MIKNSYFRVALFTLLLVSAIAAAGGIKSWSSGDTLTTTDLNANFAHIHNAMVGGHGARLVDADVSASAAIGYTKLQNGRGIARAWADVESICSADPCTISESLNVTSIARASEGVYTLTLAYTATDNVFAAFVSTSSSTILALCQGVSTSTTTATINCFEADGSIAVEDAAFHVVIFDGD